MSRAARGFLTENLLATLLQELGDERGPASLVTGANTGTVVAMEVLVEGNQIAPVWIVLKLLVGAEHGPALLSIAQEDP